MRGASVFGLASAACCTSCACTLLSAVNVTLDMLVRRRCGRAARPPPQEPAQTLTTPPGLLLCAFRRHHPKRSQYSIGYVVRRSAGWAARPLPRQHHRGRVCIGPALRTGHSAAQQGLWVQKRVKRVGGHGCMAEYEGGAECHRQRRVRVREWRKWRLLKVRRIAHDMTAI
jgi:hypothetical protein